MTLPTHALRPLWLTVILAAYAAFAAGQAHAQEETTETAVARAEAYAADAFDAYTMQDYPRAVTLYMNALQAFPSADVLYNLARIYDSKLRDRDHAIEFYERYAADPGAVPERVRTANQRLAALRELERVAAEPTPRPAAVAAPSSAPPPAQRTGVGAAASTGLSGLQVTGLVVGGIGLAGLGVGTVFGLQAKTDTDTAHESCDGNACTAQRGVDAARDAARAADVSTVSFIAGGALTLLGAALLAFGGNDDDESERAITALRLFPYADPGAVGTRVSGRW